MKKFFPVFLSLLFLLSSASFSENYPKIDISGYKKWEYKSLTVRPEVNQSIGITQLGYSPLSSGLAWQERLKLAIAADLSDKLKVTYRIDQEPEIPETFDVTVNYDNKHELTFGDINVAFTRNEFASATKSLNGVIIKSKGDNYDLKLVPTSKLRSQVQNLISQRGNGTRGPYSLGKGSIVEGSEYIEVNNKKLTRKVDYIIDYFEGKVTFTQILTPLDEIKYSFEYTNIVDFFFPTLSKRNFTGFEGGYSFNPADFVPQEEATPEYIDTTTTEVFPNDVYSLTSGEVSTSEGNAFRLSFFPVEEFSENISFEGKTLKKEEDYRLDYNDGLLRFYLQTTTTQEPVTVTYRYYRISREADSIQGTGSKGNYYFDYKGIIKNSETIKVDNKLLVRDYEHAINYARGSIMFYQPISTPSLIAAVYDHKLVDTASAEARKKLTSATVGASFLQESSKQSSSLPTVDILGEKYKGSDIIANGNAIYILNLPLVSTAEGGRLTLTKNGTTLAYGVDYVIPSVEANAQGKAVVNPTTSLHYMNDSYDLSDGYKTGTIKLLTTIEASSEVLVSYTYYKSVVARFSSYGNGGRVYDIKGYLNLVPGSEIVKVTVPGSNPTTYRRNSSPEAYDAGTTGYSINYYNNAPPQITFNDPLSIDKSFSLEFRYVPPAVVQDGDIKQQVAGADVSLKLGELLDFTAQMASSASDKVISYTSTTESFTGFDGSTRRVKLSNLPVIENSEMVYVKNYLRNREIDYSIDYTSGTINFYYITFSTTDVVSVDYNFQSSAGTQQKTEVSGSAYKWGAKSEVGFFNFNYDKRDVGSTFAPMGGLSLGIGSNSQNFSAAFDPKFHDLNIGYWYKELNDPIANKSGLFTSSYDRRYTLSINPNKAARVAVDFRRYEIAAQDQSRKSVQYDTSGGIYPVQLKRGLVTWNQKYEGKLSNSDDKVGLAKTGSGYLYLQEDIGFSDRLKLNYNYQVTEPETLSNYGTTLEAVSAKKYSRNYGYNVNLDLTMGSIKKWTNTFTLAYDEQQTIKPTYSLVETRNASYHVDFRPWTPFTTLYDYNRSETPSVVNASQNPKTERSSFSVRLDPSQRLNGGLIYSQNENVYQTGYVGKNRSNSYDFNFIPIKTSKLEFSQKLSLLYNNQLTPSGSSESSLEEQTLTQKYDLSITPFPVLTVTPGFIQTDYRNMKDGTFLNTSAQSTVVKATLNIFSTTVNGDYNLKTTTRLTDDQIRQKYIYSVKASRGFFNWGTLAYVYSYEHNMGEVLSNGTFPAQDYRTETNDASITFKIPTNTMNPVLDTIDLTGRWKQVGYVNGLKDTDNFKATSVSFEGALNF